MGLFLVRRLLTSRSGADGGRRQVHGVARGGACGEGDRPDQRDLPADLGEREAAGEAAEEGQGRLLPGSPPFPRRGLVRAPGAPPRGQRQ